MKPTAARCRPFSSPAHVSAPLTQPGASFLTTRLDDPRAVPLTGAVGDGKADDSAALQAAIDKAAARPRGRHRLHSRRAAIALTRTIYVWPAVRVIGWGAHAPGLCAGRQHAGLSAAAWPPW